MSALLAAATLMACLQSSSVAAAGMGRSSSTKPSAVFILVDDLGHNDVAYNNRSADGSTAGRKIISPNIDEMADTGIKLLHYYVHPICTPTRSALMTGRYAFRWGATGYTIGSQDPWGVPLDETFFPELLQARGWVTAMFGKWHMGMFKEDYLPTSRGFNFSTGMLSGASDHYTHVVEGAYDWHAMEQPNFEAAGRFLLQSICIASLCASLCVTLCVSLCHSVSLCVSLCPSATYILSGVGMLATLCEMMPWHSSSRFPVSIPVLSPASGSRSSSTCRFKSATRLFKSMPTTAISTPICRKGRAGHFLAWSPTPTR